MWCVGGCPVIFGPVFFFVYYPPTNSCFLSAVLFRTWTDASFLEIFSKPKAKHNIQIHFLICVFAWGSSKIIISHRVSCPLIFEPCLFFVYHPPTDSCFLSAVLFRTWPDVSFWRSFLSQEQNTKCKFIFLFVFLPGDLRK